MRSDSECWRRSENAERDRETLVSNTGRAGPCAHMASTMSRMKKAFIIAMMEAVTAVIIVLSALMRPKRRMTRKARMSLTNQSGMLSTPCAAREMPTMKTSNQFQWLRTKRLNQLPKALKSSSTVKAKVKRRLIRASRRPIGVSAPSSSVSASANWASRMLVVKFCAEVYGR